MVYWSPWSLWKVPGLPKCCTRCAVGLNSFIALEMANKLRISFNLSSYLGCNRLDNIGGSATIFVQQDESEEEEEEGMTTLIEYGLVLKQCDGNFNISFHLLPTSHICIIGKLTPQKHPAERQWRSLRPPEGPIPRTTNRKSPSPSPDTLMWSR